METFAVSRVPFDQCEYSIYTKIIYIIVIEKECDLLMLGSYSEQLLVMIVDTIILGYIIVCLLSYYGIIKNLPPFS